jgi:hypothetical protein
MDKPEAKTNITNTDALKIADHMKAMLIAFSDLCDDLEAVSTELHALSVLLGEFVDASED